MITRLERIVFSISKRRITFITTADRRAGLRKRDPWLCRWLFAKGSKLS